MGTMPTSSVGRTSGPRDRAGVTLIEMLVVVALISLMVGISFPAITSGIDSLRLNAATNGIVSFLNYGTRPRRAAPAGGRDHHFEGRQCARNALHRSGVLPQARAAGRRLHHARPSAIARTIRMRRALSDLYPGGTVPGFGMQLDQSQERRADGARGPHHRSPARGAAGAMKTPARPGAVSLCSKCWWQRSSWRWRSPA